MTKRKPKKPPKPYVGFPLTWHTQGYWVKRIRGKLHYFGSRWGSWQEALEQFQRERDDLFAGREPRAVDPEGVTIRYLCNSFLTNRKQKMEAGELSEGTFVDNGDACRRVVETFSPGRLAEDLRPEDFAKLRKNIAEGRGPSTVAAEISRVRAIFNHGFQNDLLDRPARYGTAFDKPPRKVLREWRRRNGEKMFSAEEIHKLLDKAGPSVRAMILLGVNCGFGPMDIARLPTGALDLNGGWVDHSRPKTGIGRRCKLWSETLEALRRVLELRPKPRNKTHRSLVFITKTGSSYFDPVRGGYLVGREFTKLARAVGVYRQGLGFYAFRHTFETIAGETTDQVAVDAIMGHSRDDMASVYRERIGDDRLAKVADHVREWLFGHREKLEDLLS